ncbi:MAG: methionine adenosyltransferase [Candidatus Sericytochromatia bacterium]|nr:methionine adenosyltransferase [Candidatus Sericytochromatia bacterium]
MGTSRRRLFTSESVTEGHPDKVCDQVSDAVLDAVLSQDPLGRVACETVANTGFVLVTGEMTTRAQLDIPGIVRGVLRDVGYVDARFGIDADSCGVLVALDRQSPDIAAAVDRSWELRGGVDQQDLDAAIDAVGAGDQGLVFGYACDETPDHMPLPIDLAHRLAMRLAEVRKQGEIPWLRPDGKTQVTVVYEGDRPVAVDTVLVSTQHEEGREGPALEEAIRTHVIEAVVPPHLLTSQTRLLVNPSGRFVTGGPQGDAGLTGRKIIVDTYGGYARHGGGAFSGKDPTKVDRSGAYAARHVARHVVAAGLARRCELQISYAIGKARPVSVSVDTFGTAIVDEARIEKAITEVFDLRPAGIIRAFDLQRPLYRSTAAYGHFGDRPGDRPWERLDRLEDLKACFVGVAQA